ncbi:MAG: outer membrane protein assembly factor BamD [Gammaproteobacteria bacterium]|jgi:outer membrane protein assembly factor BamD
MKKIIPHTAVAVLICTVAACASDPGVLPPTNPFDRGRVTQRELRLEAEGLYKAARQSLESSDFVLAIERYNQVVARYPFSAYAIQAELERLYAYHRNFENDLAVDAADRFLRDHPRHPFADYVHYLKGVVNQSREDSFAASLGFDSTKEDVSYARRAFDDFSLLVQKYPDSRYAADARQRMVYLRNRIAANELHVVRYYQKRGADLAAARRAEQVVARYPGTPAARQGLILMEQSYRRLGLTQQADDAQRLMAANGVDPVRDNVLPDPPLQRLGELTLELMFPPREAE